MVEEFRRRIGQDTATIETEKSDLMQFINLLSQEETELDFRNESFENINERLDDLIKQHLAQMRELNKERNDFEMDLNEMTTAYEEISQ